LSDNDRKPELIRVARPLVRGKLVFEPVVPLDGPVTDGPLNRVARPLVRGTLPFEPAVPLYLELTLTLRPDTDKDTVAAVFEKLTTLVELLNGYEAELGGTGFAVDEPRSGIKAGPAVGLVLLPNDPNGAERRLAKVAELLAKAASEYAGKAGVVAGVFSATDPKKPLFSVAA
jgi:hypothetical protein